MYDSLSAALSALDFVPSSAGGLSAVCQFRRRSFPALVLLPLEESVEA